MTRVLHERWDRTLWPSGQRPGNQIRSSNIDAYFSSSSSCPTFPVPFGLAAADVSGDNIPDLELNGYTSTLQPAIFLLTQSAPGTFTASNTITIPNGKSFNVNGTPGPNNTVVPGSTVLPSQIIALDLNGDGYLDVAAIDPNVGQTLLLVSQVAPLTGGQTSYLQVLSGGALPQFAQADFNLDGYPDLMVPGLNSYPYQSAPVLIQNGTINVGVLNYTPSNGQVLTGQNFNNINFSGSTVSASSISTARRPSNPLKLVGKVFLDLNGNSRYSPHESSVSGLLLYLDMDQNGHFDPATDPSFATNAQGYFEFSNLVPGRTYTIRVANLPSTLSANPVTVTMPATSGNGLVERFIGVSERWSISQPVRSVDPLTPIVVDLAPLAFRRALGVKPLYEFTGAVPAGMTIDPYTGVIQWTPSIGYAGSTVSVSVRIIDSADRSPLETQVNVVQIRVNAVSPFSAYIRDVFGVLMGRLPSAAELNYWSARLRSGTSRLSFVNGLAHTDEHYTLLADATYLTVLSRRPTATELASALVMFRAGGNSDQLTRSLLSSPSFILKHKGYFEYVKAVDQILTLGTVPKSRMRAQVAWLRMGGSRAVLVRRVSRSKAATRARVMQLTGRYIAITSGDAAFARWTHLTIKLKLNSDTLLDNILASAAFLGQSRSRPVPNIQSNNSSSSPQYNRLNHLEFALTGADATRPLLDALESQLYEGQTWNELAAGVYNSRAAFNYRVQTQFKNLLHRTATSGELAHLARTLPAGNQVDALLVQILSGTEYRRRFGTTSAYVTEVYRVLTGAGPDAKTLTDWVRKLDRGVGAGHFVNSVNSSRAGEAGQVNREYADYLLRDPSQLELDHWLRGCRCNRPQDRTIALAIANSPEFQEQQRTAQLLPDN